MFFFLKIGKKLGVRERVCEFGVFKECYIIVFEVLFKWMRVFGFSFYYYVEV